MVELTRLFLIKIFNHFLPLVFFSNFIVYLIYTKKYKETGLPIYLKTWKNLEFDNFEKKKLEKPGI